MLTLVINTTGKNNQLAIFDRDSKLAEYISNESEKRSGTEKLKSITGNLLKDAKTPIKNIELLIVIIGPGSYTGSRSGLAFAKALSHATEIPLVGVSLFDVFAKINEQEAFPFVIAIPAGENRFYIKKFSIPTDVYHTRSKGNIKQKLSKKGLHIFSDQPSLDQINLYGQEFFRKNGPDNFKEILPLYLKEPNITKPNKKQDAKKV